MNATCFNKTPLAVALMAALNSPLLLAAPGTLPVSPLFIGASVEPNVYFIADDSGSMDWDLLVQGGSEGLPYLDGWYGNYYILPTRANTYDAWYYQDYPDHYPYVVPDESSVAGAWIAFNHNYNAMYYNPGVRYQPWPGTDSSNNPLYTNSTPSAAPVMPGSSSTFNLTANFTFTNYTANLGWYSETIYPAKYYTWTDSNGNGVVDASDDHTLVRITSSTGTYTGSSDRTDCASAPTCTYAEEIQNFANWFTYYRKRSLTARSAMGTVVNGTDNKRMGLDAFNAGNRVNAATMSSDSNRRTLLQSIYSLPANGGTPARTALKRVGSLFEGASSPILGASQGGACQQNFAVMVTDGYWNDSSDPGVDNADGDANTDFDGGSYADTWSDTLADIAMHYYERDLKAYPNMVRTTDKDTNEGQHLVTFSIAFGLTGTLDPDTDDPTAAGFSGWPDPISNPNAERIDDLWHAAYNGRGEYVSAGNPEELATGLANALGNIEGRRGSAAAVAFNTTSLSTNSKVYLALFNSDDWDGDLMAYALDPFTGDINANASWRAASQLDSRNLTSSPRTILTSNGTEGTAFQWGSLTTAQKNDLRTNSAGTLDTEATGMARLAFLRGDRGCEEGNTTGTCSYSDGTNTFNSKTLRARASRLGDIIHSTPVYVGAPSLDWPAIAPFPTTAGSTYADWRAAHQNRSGVIYVGANDGMLHGFSEASGQEVMAYIPNQVYSTSSTAGLHYLTDPGYNHYFYVDLAPAVSDVHIRTTTTGTSSWKTILVGGLRSGGAGLFALDVTNPGSFSETGGAPADTVLWEFTHRDLGYTFSRPTIAMLDSGDWVAIFGNGYNTTNTGSNSSCSSPGQAALFVLKLEGGIDGTWTAGTDYHVVCTGVGTEADRNGLATPAVVDTDGNGTADRVYAGDLRGNLWAFSLGSTPAVAYKQGSTPKPLFTTASGQPITTAPEVVRNTSVTTNNVDPNTLVLFGTGQYLVTADTTSTTQQAFYGIWDHGSHSLDQGDLIEQTLTTSGDRRTLSSNAVNYGNSVHGWYFNLGTGERVVTNPLVRGDVVLFTTTIPDSDPCLGGGTGWLMAANFLTGGSTAEIELDVNGDGVLNDLDKTDGGDTIEGKKLDPGVGMPSDTACMGNNCYISGTNVVEGDEVDNTAVKDLGGIGTGRLSWEELRCAPGDADCTR
ncbi:MAG: pilus assembly protein [Pseudomonadota bacterium]